MKKVFIVLALALLASGAAFAASDSTLKQNPNSGSAAPGWVLPEATISEGFEGGAVPPAGWVLDQSNPNETWYAGTLDPHSGTYNAEILYDEALVPQNEALYTPLLVRPITLTVDFWSLGSIYWCRDTYDNCDLNVYLDADTEFGNGNETLVYTADATWPASWTWAQSTVDLTAEVAGEDLYVAFVYQGLDGAQVSLDDITIDYEEGASQNINPLAIPTLGLAGMLALAVLLAGVAVALISRRG